MAQLYKAKDGYFLIHNGIDEIILELQSGVIWIYDIIEKQECPNSCIDLPATLHGRIGTWTISMTDDAQLSIFVSDVATGNTIAVFNSEFIDVQEPKQ